MATMCRTQMFRSPRVPVTRSRWEPVAKGICQASRHRFPGPTLSQLPPGGGAAGGNHGPGVGSLDGNAGFSEGLSYRGGSGNVDRCGGRGNRHRGGGAAGSNGNGGDATCSSIGFGNTGGGDGGDGSGEDGGVPGGGGAGNWNSIKPGGKGGHGRIAIITYPKAIVTLGSLERTYTGVPLGASASTLPTDLDTVITYDGSTNLPVNAGTYAVRATVSSPPYSGEATNVFIIHPAPSSILVHNLERFYDGVSKYVTATTDPPNLPVEITYDGTAGFPSEAGEYSVVATITEGNYAKSVTNTLVIAPTPDTTYWHRHSSRMTQGRWRHTTTYLPGDKVLVTGGGNAGAELFDLRTGVWTNTGSMNVGRTDHTATLLNNGKVLVVGGGDGAEIYDPSTGTWSGAGNLSAGRSSHSAVLLDDGRVLVCGGGPLVTEIYDPRTGAWTDAGSLMVSRTWQAATKLADGRVLICGGRNGHASAEVFDPATRAWTQTASMSIHREQHTANLLPNGKVLVAGGYNSSERDVFTAELYDPITGDWTPTASMNNPRSLHAAVSLPDGRVMVLCGGSARGLNTGVTAEIYDPATERWTPAGRLNERRWMVPAVALPNGFVFVAGTYQNSSSEIYDPNGFVLTGAAAPPAITNQPKSLIWVHGADARLQAGVDPGAPQPTLQWHFNGVQIENANTDTLILPAVAPEQCGTYSLLAQSVGGIVWSDEVVVTLPGRGLPVPDRRPPNAPVIRLDGLDPVDGAILRGERTTVTMSTAFPNGTIYYTTDGREPIAGANAVEYQGPFTLFDSSVIRAVAWDALFSSSVSASPVTVEIRSLFEAEPYSKGGGSVTIDTPTYSGSLFVSNTLLRATATAANDWVFAHWIGATNTATNAGTRVVEDIQLEAVFGTPHSTISGGPGAGQVRRVPDLAIYPYGSRIRLLAQPDAGSYFLRWQPGGETDNSLPVEITSPNQTNSAVFAPLLAGFVTLVTDVVGNGRVTVSPLQGQYATGSGVTLTATPDTDYRFVGWAGDLISANNPQALTLNSVKSVQAVFAPDVRVTMSPTSQNVVAGAAVTLGVGAAGPPPLSYQWRFNGVNIPGANGPLHSILSSEPVDAGNYDVVVAHGGMTVTSRVAAVTVSPPGPVIQWGNTPNGIPNPITNIAVIAAGTSHALAFQDRSRMMGWGDNSEGQISAPLGLAGVVALAGGLDHSVAVRGDGLVAAWGRNNFGQINVPLGLNNIVRLSAGFQFTLALDSKGRVVAWGRADSGQLNVPAGLIDVIDVAAGNGFGLALQAGGTVAGWGNNGSGQTSVPPNVTNAVAIAAGDAHALAVLNNGSVVAWGENGEGQATVPPGLSGVVSVAAGSAHSIALKRDGTLVAWGRNNHAQLTLPNGLNQVAAVSAATDFTMALRTVPPVAIRVNRSGADVRLSWPSPAGAYRVYSTDNIGSPLWSPANVPITTDGPTSSVEVRTTNEHRYFRLRAE